MSRISRRLLLAAPLATAAAGLAGCGFGPMAGGGFAPPSREGRTLGRPDYRLVYGTWPGEQHPVTAFNYEAVDPAYLRQEVAYLGPEAPGTVVVDPRSHHLYFVEGNGR